jgi:hypothetical protein
MQHRCLPWCQPKRRAAEVQSGSSDLLLISMAANAHVRASILKVTLRRLHFTGVDPVEVEMILGACISPQGGGEAEADTDRM